MLPYSIILVDRIIVIVFNKSFELLLAVCFGFQQFSLVAFSLALISSPLYIYISIWGRSYSGKDNSDLSQSWELIKSLIARPTLQNIFVAARIQDNSL